MTLSGITLLFRTHSTCTHFPSVVSQPVRCWSGPATGTLVTMLQSSYGVLVQFISRFGCITQIAVSRFPVTGRRGKHSVRRKRVVLHVFRAYWHFPGYNGPQVADAVDSSRAEYGLCRGGNWWRKPYKVKHSCFRYVERLTEARYRAPKSTRGHTDADMAATGFLDGDFIEQFLSLSGSKEMVQKIMAGTSDPEKLNVKVEELQRVVESLQSMH